MRAYVIRRLAQFLPVLVLGAVAVWAMVYALPGDPAQLLAGENATPQQLAAVRGRLGLDQPMWQQFLTWIGHALRGDLGTSFVSGRTVSSLLVDRIPATIQLAALTLLFVVVLAVPLGMVVALKPGTWLARAVSVFLAATLATPGFWLGLLLIALFSVHYRLLPAASVFIPLWKDPIGGLTNVVMPALALALHASSVTARFVASSLSDVMDSDYIRTARAKGAPERTVLLRHATRNAMLPTVTVVGLQLGAFLGGAIVVEVVFTYPGLGRLLYTAIGSRDYALVQGVILFILVVFLVLNLLVDLLYAYLDPRIRLR